MKRGSDPPFRPNITDAESVNPLVLKLMAACWKEDPEERPSLDDIKHSLKTLNKGKYVIVLYVELSCINTTNNKCSDMLKDRCTS